MKCKITDGEIINLGEEGDEVEVSEDVYHSFADKLEVLDNDDVHARNEGEIAETGASVEETPNRAATDEAAGEADSGERDQSIQEAETAASAPETVSEGEADATQNLPDMEGEGVDLSEMSVPELESFLDEHEDDLSDEDLDRMYEAEESGEDRQTAKKAIDAKRS